MNIPQPLLRLLVGGLVAGCAHRPLDDTAHDLDEPELDDPHTPANDARRPTPESRDRLRAAILAARTMPEAPTALGALRLGTADCVVLVSAPHGGDRRSLDREQWRVNTRPAAGRRHDELVYRAVWGAPPRAPDADVLVQIANGVAPTPILPAATATAGRKPCRGGAQ